MTETMKERGPDALGLHVHGGTAFGHRRLKIIDLSERAHQPMVDNALGLSIIYNAPSIIMMNCGWNWRGKAMIFFLTETPKLF